MDIGRTDGVGGPGRIDAPHRANRIAKAYGTAGPQAPGDKVSISAEAALVSKALAIPEVRQERIQEIRALLQSGRFDTDARLSGAIDRFLVENPDLGDE